MSRMLRPATTARASYARAQVSLPPTATATRSQTFLNGGPYSELDLQSTNTHGYGVALQATNRTPLFEHPNQFIAGISFDGGQTLFGASTQIGGLSLEDRVFAGPGVTIDQADGSIAPVRVAVGNAYYGVFFTDSLDLTPALTANLSGRYNFAQINLSDQIGDCADRRPHFWPFQPRGRPDLEIPARCAASMRVMRLPTVRRRRPN